MVSGLEEKEWMRRLVSRLGLMIEMRMFVFDLIVVV